MTVAPPSCAEACADPNHAVRSQMRMFAPLNESLTVDPVDRAANTRSVLRRPRQQRTEGCRG